MKLKRWCYSSVENQELIVYELNIIPDINIYGVNARTFWRHFIDREVPNATQLQWKLQNYANIKPDEFIYWEIKDQSGNNILIVAAQSLSLLTEFAAVEGYSLAKTFWRRFAHIDFVDKVQQAFNPISD